MRIFPFLLLTGYEQVRSIAAALCISVRREIRLRCVIVQSL